MPTNTGAIVASAPPIEVSPSPLPAMLATFGRDVLKAAGAALVARGVMSESMANEASGIIIFLVPVIYSQLKTLWNKRDAVTMARALPDRVAFVKGEGPPS